MGDNERARRFARLRPRTGDLFEHFGVPESPVPAVAEPPVRAATACPACGWYRPAPLQAACWLCGACA